MLQYLQIFSLSADYLQNTDNQHICSAILSVSADLPKNLYQLLSILVQCHKVPSVGVKERLGWVFSLPQWHAKSRNLALPWLQHSVFVSLFDEAKFWGHILHLNVSKQNGECKFFDTRGVSPDIRGVYSFWTQLDIHIWLDEPNRLQENLLPRCSYRGLLYKKSRYLRLLTGNVPIC